MKPLPPVPSSILDFGKALADAFTDALDIYDYWACENVGVYLMAYFSNPQRYAALRRRYRRGVPERYSSGWREFVADAVEAANSL